jgi:hypothetical protein
VAVSSSRGGRTLALATGKVVVSVYGKTALLARQALATMTPLNETGEPLQALPAPLPDTGFNRVPLPTQVPPGVGVPRGPA